MNHQSVSTPLNMREGVRGKSGRPLAAHLVAQPRPQLGEEARRLLAVASAGRCHIQKFAEAMLADPSPAGVQALAHLAWSERENALRKHPTGPADPAFDDAKVLDKATEECARLLGAIGAHDRFREVLTERLVGTYAAGVEAGKGAAKEQLEADRSQPVRRTEFVSDATGKITGKIEYELKPGGKS